jgi:hypothetical protein
MVASPVWSWLRSLVMDDPTPPPGPVVQIGLVTPKGPLGGPSLRAATSSSDPGKPNSLGNNSGRRAGGQSEPGTYLFRVRRQAQGRTHQRRATSWAKGLSGEHGWEPLGGHRRVRNIIRANSSVSRRLYEIVNDSLMDGRISLARRTAWEAIAQASIHAPRVGAIGHGAGPGPPACPAGGN